MRFVLGAIAALAGCVFVLPIVVLSIPFLIVNALTRWGARLIEPPHLTHFQVVEYDLELGWKPRPNLDTYQLMIDLFHIRTGPDGWRGSVTLSESDIVVFGDSFAAGYGVAERHFFGNVRAHPRIKSIGTGGYSMVQEYLCMRQVAARLSGKLVVWFIYFGNDLYDNLVPDLRGYRKPFLRPARAGGGWELFSEHVSPERWPILSNARLEDEHHLPRLADLCCPGYLSERAYSACDFLVGAGRQLCDEAGAQLVVMTIPDALQLTPQGQARLRALGGMPAGFDADYPDHQLAAICRKHRVQVLPGKSFLDAACYKVNDCHWTEAGNRRVADKLAELHTGCGTLRAAPVLDNSTPQGTLSTVEQRA